MKFVVLKAKVGDKGEGKGRGVQRGKLRKGEKCRLLLRFCASPPSFGFPFAYGNAKSNDFIKTINRKSTPPSFAFNFALSNLLYIMHGIPYIFSAFIVLHSFGFYVTIKIYFY